VVEEEAAAAVASASEATVAMKTVFMESLL
jgi:hypothetical protein